MKSYYSLVIVLLTTLAPHLSAAVSDEDFAAMRAQLSALAERLNALEAENRELRTQNRHTVQEIEVNRRQVATAGSVRQVASRADSIHIKGDFRYRYESIDEENKSRRERNRVRARAAILAQVDEDVAVGLGFASGGDDPVSTNQTLGEGGSSKDMRLDLAYFNWAVTDNLNIIAGKYKNIYYRPQKHALIWDGDYNPEGFALTWTPGSLFVNASGTWLESDNKKANNTFAYATQAGFKGTLGDAKVTAGLAYQAIDTAGKSPFYGEADDFFGNSFVCSDPVAGIGCEYGNDFHTVHGFADLGMMIAEMPVNLFVDYVQNTEADDFNTGYAVGLKLGKTSAAGTWDLSYVWQDIEADSTLGLLTDSDFGGGGTDGKGHVLKGGYGVSKRWSLGITYFSNEVDGNSGNKHDYERIMLDTRFKY